MYWTTYEYQYVNNSFLPEDRWQAHVDWIVDNFLPYGFDLISTDGWIEGSTKINAHGYVRSHNDSWQHDWSYWAGYCNAKGLDLGIYYNPLWVTETARNDSCVRVKGTNIPVIDITNDDDVFDGGQERVLYWVDVTKPGAEEFIKGYVRYFIEAGAKFLRIDFLSSYEDTPFNQKGRIHGSENYEQALRWMNEEAGDEILLSLVMPNLYNHGKNELKHGDMVRIDEDVFGGGWDHISDRRRGIRQENWSQWANAFDGFTAFSDISGRGSLILDGDFLRANTFSNDTERKSAVSIFIMAGSPIAIADQLDTIGNNYWVFQNKELNELNKKGFVAKPLNGNSQIWVGQLPSADWVVGLFNRETSPQTRSIDFNNDLGISGSVLVRDLWEHEDKGSMTNYSANLDSHDCKILKIKNNKKIYQAEVASLIGGPKINNNHTGHTGFAFVEKVQTEGAMVLFAIEAQVTGEYTIRIRYANATEIVATANIYVNDVKSDKLSLPKLSDWHNE